MLPSCRAPGKNLADRWRSLENARPEFYGVIEAHRRITTASCWPWKVKDEGQGREHIEFTLTKDQSVVLHTAYFLVLILIKM